MEIGDTEIDRLAGELIDQYNLIEAYRSFRWKSEGLPTAWERRLVLQQGSASLDASPGDDRLLEYADTVYRWGFNKPLPSKFRTQLFAQYLAKLVVAWRSPSMAPECRASKIDTLSDLMTIKDLKIATASKFICFIDQSGYGIYDSRVSIALRNLLIGDQRAFPIVSRRAPKGKVAWPANTMSSPRRIAERYWDYLRLLRAVASRVGQDQSEIRLGKPLLAAEIEMALFMLGDVWQEQPEVR